MNRRLQDCSSQTQRPPLVRIAFRDVPLKASVGARTGEEQHEWDSTAPLELAVVVLAGVNTHACVRTTAIDAYQRDYDLRV